MRLLYYDEVRHPQREERLGIEFIPSLHQLLSQSDFISLHVPLTEKTWHIIGSQEFAVMKPTAVLVNTSRGSIVDQNAFYQALKSGQIFAAGIDVIEVEPISQNDPLLTLENVTVTPHIGSASVTTRTKMATMAATNLVAGLRGEIPPNCVNHEVHKPPLH